MMVQTADFRHFNDFALRNRLWALSHCGTEDVV
jgi:hypothetical protein